MAKKKNRNIVPLKSVKDLENEIEYKDFKYKEYFTHICDLIPDKELEKITIKPIDEILIRKQGLVYVFVINNKIFKIGHTITCITKRINSYNCGKREYRISGTNSTTNYFVLQSLIEINQIVNVFGFFPEHPRYELFGKTYKDSYPVSKRAENEIIKDFVLSNGKKPIGCTQS